MWAGAPASKVEVDHAVDSGSRKLVCLEHIKCESANAGLNNTGGRLRLAGDTEACARRRRREEMRHGDIDKQLSAALDKSEIERAAMARVAEENERLVHVGHG